MLNTDPNPPDNPAGSDPVLHLFCGRIAAGKSTLARKLARRYNAVLISEDHWLSELYPDEIKSFKDYIKYSRRLQTLITPHCVALLNQGASVVFDFPANTPETRSRAKDIIEQTGAKHFLHYITTSPEICKKQLAKRMTAEGSKASPIALNEFDSINQLFVPPQVEEGFNVEINGC